MKEKNIYVHMTSISTITWQPATQVEDLHTCPVPLRMLT